MAVRFRDKDTGQLVLADTPEAFQEAKELGLEQYDLPNPATYIDTSTGQALLADNIDALNEAKATPSLRLATQQEIDQRRQPEIARERAAVEAEAGAKFLEQQPIRTAIAAAAQRFATTQMPFGIGEKLISLAGLPAEEQERLAEASPLAAKAGTALGVAGLIPQIVATGGAAAEAQIAGRAAAATAAAGGAGRLAQSLAAARATALAAPTAVEATAPLMSAGARIAGATEAAITTAAPALRTGIVGRVATGAVGAGLASSLVEPTEALVEGRPVSGEAIVSNMKVAALLGGAVGGAIGSAETLAPVGKWFANTETARRIGSKMGESRAAKIYNTHAPGLYAKVSRQAGAKDAAGPITLINEAADQGLVSPFDDAITMMNKVQEAKQKSGQLIGRISAEADASLGKPLDVSKMWDRMSDRVILPMSQKGPTQNEAIARKLMNDVRRFQEVNGNEMTLSNLAKLRSEIDDAVYGATPLQIQDPTRTQYYNGLRQFRHILTEEIGNGVEQSRIPIAAWRAAQRQYRVVSHAERVAAKAVGRFAKDNDLTGLAGIENLVSVGTALLSSTGAGVGLKATLASLRYGVPRSADWAKGAVYRATQQKAPAALVQNLEALQAQQLEAAQGRISSLSLQPQYAAQDEFLNAYDRVLQTLERVKARPQAFSKRYRVAAEQAKAEMERSYLGLRPASERPIVGMSTVLGPDGKPMPIYGAPIEPPSVEQMGDAIERARDIFSRATTPMGTKQVPIYRSVATEQQEAVQLMRGMRDDLSLLLADESGMWGASRLARAQEEAERLIATYSDPARIARLKAIQDEALRVQKEVTSKADKLMGATGAFAATKAPGKIDKLYDRAVEAFEPAPALLVVETAEPTGAP